MTATRTRTVKLTYTNDGGQRRGFDVGGLRFRLELEVSLMFNVPSMTADGVGRALISGWEAMWEQHRKRTGLVLMEPELDTAFGAFAEAQGAGLLAVMRGAEDKSPPPYVASCPFEPEYLGSVRLELVQEEEPDDQDDWEEVGGRTARHEEATKALTSKLQALQGEGAITSYAFGEATPDAIHLYISLKLEDFMSDKHRRVRRELREIGEGHGLYVDSHIQPELDGFEDDPEEKPEFDPPNFGLRLVERVNELMLEGKVLSMDAPTFDVRSGMTHVSLPVTIPRADWLRDGGLEVMGLLTELEQEGYELTPRISPADEL